MTRDELIEKVILETGGTLTHREASAAADIVLEEAARIAEERPPRSSTADGDETEAYFMALDDAAAAIRSMKSGGEYE